MEKIYSLDRFTKNFKEYLPLLKGLVPEETINLAKNLGASYRFIVGKTYFIVVHGEVPPVEGSIALVESENLMRKIIKLEKKVQ